MIRFACVLNHSLLIRFPSFLVSINFLYNSFSIIENITSLCCVCWSWSQFLFLYQLFTFHRVSYLLLIYFKFIRCLIDIFPVIVVIKNGFKFKLSCKRSPWWFRSHIFTALIQLKHNLLLSRFECEKFKLCTFHFCWIFPNRLKYIR